MSNKTQWIKAEPAHGVIPINDQSGRQVTLIVPHPDQEANAAKIANALKAYDILKAITDCYGVGHKDTESFVRHVHGFMIEARVILNEAGIIKIRHSNDWKKMVEELTK